MICRLGKLEQYCSGIGALGKESTHNHPLTVWACLSSCSLLVSVSHIINSESERICSPEQTSVATAVSSIGTALNIQGSLSWIGTSFLLTSTITQPVCGRAAVRISCLAVLLVLNQ